MDKSTFRHRFAVVWDDEFLVDVFVRGDDGNVEHYWTDGDDTMSGPEDLGGSFDTDPILIGGGLIGRSGTQLVHWTWDRGIGRRWLGQPTVAVLPGMCATDPAVMATVGRIDVFSPSLNGPMLHWLRLHDEGVWRDPEVLTDDLADAFTQPCAVLRTSPDPNVQAVLWVFAVGADGGLLRWSDGQEGWTSERLTRSSAGEGLTGRPVAVESEPGRVDVFAVRNDGVPIHWGFAGTRVFPDEIRLRDDTVAVPGDLTLVSTRPKQITLLDGGDQAWNLDPEGLGEWRGQGFDGGRVFKAGQGSFQDPATGNLVTQDRMSVLDRGLDGSFTIRSLVFSNRHTIDGKFVWQEDGSPLELPLKEPGPAPPDITPAIVVPELLARRPEDLLLLGVRWNDQVEALAGPPGELLASDGAELTVTLPPQHIAETVVAAEGVIEAFVNPDDGGVPVWGSNLAGASRVTVNLVEGTRVPLTVEGVLQALRVGRLAPSADATEERTQLELPYRLVMTPYRPDNGPIALDHAATPVEGAGGAVGLWNTRIAAEGATATDPAGLTMRPLAAESDDPFPTSLSGASRARILLEEPTARIDRLRLSALGGSLTASGVWETFEWDHVAAMGRDLKVRTATKGVLYPWGHPAVLVETSERRFETTDEGAIAHLRKKSVLVVTTPVKDLPPSRSFPFTRVTLQRTLADLGVDPDSQYLRRKPLPPPGADKVKADRAFVVQIAGGILTNLYGDDGFTAGETVAEVLASSSDVDPDTAFNAGKLVEAAVAIRRADDTLAALAFVSTPEPGIYLVPGGTGSPISFPAILSGPSGEVHLDLPVVFFADVRIPEGLTHPAYRSLEDPDMLQGVVETWRDLGDGEVVISPLRIDMVGSATPEPADRPEVRALHIVGESTGGTFGPRLGPPPAADLPEESWAFEMATSELSTLTGAPGGTVPTLRVAMSPELLGGASEPGLLFQAVGDGELKALFSQNSVRSGGLAAPDLTVNGFSRTGGPVDAETFLTQVAGGDLDPAKFLGEQASLLGFGLAELLRASGVKQAPQILSTPAPGRPPTVTMKWPQVPLATTTGALVTHAQSTMSIDVTLAENDQTVDCTVKDITLAFPDRDESVKLLEIHLPQISFHQQGGGAPSISLDGDISTEFFGFLKLLEDLQKAVQIAGASPSIQASDRGVTARFDLPVPDITSGMFQLTGLAFHAIIDVPFDNRPVTIGLAFASKEDPFNVSVLALGGGGYVDIVLDSTGLQRFELTLEFGASLEVDFKVAQGEVHAMGGICVVAGDKLELQGYLRFGGMVEVLGLVSVSVELMVTLTYKEERNALVGEATLVIEVDLLLFSDSVELDSGEWVISGDDEAAPASERLPAPPPGLLAAPGFLLPRGNATDPFLGLGRAAGPVVDADAWSAYRGAFDTEALP